MTGGAGGNGIGPGQSLPTGACAPAAPPDTNPPAGSETAAGGPGPLRRVVRIVNPLGLHQRVADRFSRTARNYACEVSVWNGPTRADGKDIWSLLFLVAECDAEVVLEVDGPDGPAAVAVLAEILASPSGEDYTI